MVSTAARIRVRAEIFRSLRHRTKVARWWSLNTNVTLISCTLGAVAMGLVGLANNLLLAYAVVMALILLALLASVMADQQKRRLPG